MTTADATPTETADDVLDRVGALQPLIRHHAAQNERDRKVSDDVVDALKDAGAFRLAAPRRFSGLEQVCAPCSTCRGDRRADGGTSWVTTLSNINAWSTCLFDQAAVAEIYDSGPDTILSGVVSPAVRHARCPAAT